MKAIKFSKIKEGDSVFVFGKDGETETTNRGVVTRFATDDDFTGATDLPWWEVTLNNNYSFELYEGEHVVILLDRPKATE